MRLYCRAGIVALNAAIWTACKEHIFVDCKKATMQFV